MRMMFNTRSRKDGQPTAARVFWHSDAKLSLITLYEFERRSLSDKASSSTCHWVPARRQRETWRRITV